ncbi:MAG: SDR family oxidoreductase [Planctomycetes bacterium]|nr:SDR family oxidoreductase [Planctomycetota bacterium]
MSTRASRSHSVDPAALRDRCILLAGATGAVGGAVLERLRDAGARIAAAVRKPRQVADLRERLGAAPHLVAVVDSDDTEAAAGFVKGVEDALGPVDALISTAGAFAFARVGDDPAGLDRQLFDANFAATHTLVRAVVRPMLRRQTGSLVFTGARAVGQAGPGMALYAATKAALHEYARVLQAEVGSAGLAVRVITPGLIDTPANRRAMPGADPAGFEPLDGVVDALLAASLARSPASPDDPLLWPVD